MTILFVILAMALAILGGPLGPGKLYAQAATSTPLVITTPTPILPTPTPNPTATPAQTQTQPVSVSPASDGMHVHAAGHRVYTVQAGDTLLRVALEVGLDLEDAYCLLYPSFTWKNPLVIGDRLSIPDPGTICHEVVPGDTVVSIAADYDRQAQQIAGESWNELSAVAEGNHPRLTVGHHLRIPPMLADETAEDAGQPLASENKYVEGVLPLILNQDVNADIDRVVAVGKVFSLGEAPAVGGIGGPLEAPVPSDWPYGSGHFSWPIYGWLTQGYKSDHRAVDVAAPAGTAVTAADRGVVIRAGWNNQGYGNFVIIDHNIDYITLYAHMSEVLVEEGEIVASGQVLGRVGSTGNSTGPHLHFEIRDFGRRADPLAYLME